MKRKLLILLLAVASALCLALGLSACKVDNKSEHTHDYGTLVAEQPATCTQTGVKAHYYCAGCEKYFDEEKVETSLADLTIPVDQTAHNYGEKIAEQPATCMQTGLEAHYYCDVCQKYFDENKVAKTLEDLIIPVDQTAHNYGAKIAEQPATCMQTGLEAHYHCDVCQKYFDEDKVETSLADLTIPVDQTAHNYGAKIAEQPATCMQTGLEAHYHCDFCQKYFDENKVAKTLEDLTIPVDESAHKWNSGTVTKAATCTEQGTKNLTCEYNPEHTKEDTIPIDESAHKWNGGTVTKAATCTEQGTKKYTCEYDPEHTKEENTPIDKTAHNYGALIDLQPATCANMGMKAHYRCNLCEKYFNEDKVETIIENLNIPIDKNSHSLNAGSTVCTVCGKQLTNGMLRYTAITDNGETVAYSVEASYAAGTDIIIPAKYNGKPVTEIKDNAFRTYSSIQSIIIPNSVVKIGANAFYGCTQLYKITIGSGVTSIGDDAFYDCGALKKVYITDIAAWCNIDFGNVSRYKNNPLTTDTQLFLNEELLTDLVIPEGVPEIKAYAFYNCANLENVTIGNDVTSIGNCAFYNCTSLTSIVISDSVKTIGNKVFGYLYRTSLTSVTIGSGVTSIGQYAFDNCTSLKNVYITDIAAWCNIEFEDLNANPLCYADNLYLNNTLVKEIEIPKGITFIPAYAFSCKNLENIIIPDSVTSIGRSAFSDCTSLESITIPNNVSSIGKYAFSGCSATINWGDNPIIQTIGQDVFYGYEGTSITIPDSVKTIGEYAFRGCTSITTITIPDSVKTIGEYAFSGCTSITTITIPGGVTEIGSYAFENCTSLESVEAADDNENYASQDGILYNKAKTTFIIIPQAIKGAITIPNSITSIGAWFKVCKNLTSITIPDSVTSISSSAFSGCTSLESITLPFVGNGSDKTHFGYIFGASTYSENSKYIPTSLKTVIITGGASIDSFAFNQCSSLTSIEIPDSVTTIDRYAFYGCSSLESITIGENVTNIGKNAFYNCSSLTNITIPDSVTEIGDNAFYNCSSLESIALGDFVTSIGQYAFSGCASLTNATLNSGAIGDRAFENCALLESVIFGDGVTAIGQYAFSGCTSLTSATFENTDGWEVSTNSNMLNSKSITVTDPAQNAACLKYSFGSYYYGSYYWKRG